MGRISFQIWLTTTSGKMFCFKLSFKLKTQNSPSFKLKSLKLRIQELQLQLLKKYFIPKKNFDGMKCNE